MIQIFFMTRYLKKKKRQDHLWNQPLSRGKVCGLPAGDNVGTEGNLSPNGTVDLLRGYVFCGEISGHNDRPIMAELHIYKLQGWFFFFKDLVTLSNDMETCV